MKFVVLLPGRKACNFPAALLSLGRETIIRLIASQNKCPYIVYAIPQTDKICK